MVENEKEEEISGIALSEPIQALPSVNDKVEVFWPKDDRHYPGTVANINNDTGKRHVKYDDGDEETLDFTQEKWRLISNSARNKSENSINLVFDHLRKMDCSSSRSPHNVHVVINVDNPSDPRFYESSREEAQGLLDRGTYVVVSEEDVPPGSTIPRSRVIHPIKKDLNSKEKFKTRLVIQGHLDPEKRRVVNEAPTILRSSSRIILSIAESLEFQLWSRDVKQAFLQSEDKLQRDLYIKPPL